MPPALSVSTMNGYAVVLLKALDQILALPDERPTVEHEAAATEDPGQKVSQRPRHLAERVNTSALSCRAAMDSPISRSRVSLPLRAA